MKDIIDEIIELLKKYHIYILDGKLREELIKIFEEHDNIIIEDEDIKDITTFSYEIKKSISNEERKSPIKEIERKNIVPTYENFKEDKKSPEENDRRRKIIEIIRMGTNKTIATISKKDQTQKETELQKIYDEAKNIVFKKNQDYNDAFHRLYEEYGIFLALIHLQEKYERVKTLSNREAVVANETLIDSLFDLLNYAVLTIYELRYIK